MSFRIQGLSSAPFQALFGAEEATLAAAGVQRVRVVAPYSAPCRITLDDADVGETVLLLTHMHQPAQTPYRQQGPIFVRERPGETANLRNEIPPALRRRLLSLRAFDAAGMMVDADVVDGADAAAMIERLFADPAVDAIHAHYARRGCFAAHVTR
ncbi:MAG: DUF1203 domain-containing protein [Hyphomonadaceae bacterium]|nr:DUF1203 domain-containing protein [Hyphomonadaceae bacterium]